MSGTEDHLTEEAFAAALRSLLAGRTTKVWLVKSAGGRLDTVFSVGTEQGEEIRNFDHLGGFYLLGEGVARDLVEPIHALFTRYCASHRAVVHTRPSHIIDMRYWDEWHTQKKERNRLVLHVPFSVQTGGK